MTLNKILISKQIFCVVWKTCTQESVCFTTAYMREKLKKKTNKKTVGMVLLVFSKVGLGSNSCPMLNIYDIVPKIERINKLTNYADIL